MHKVLPGAQILPDIVVQDKCRWGPSHCAAWKVRYHRDVERAHGLPEPSRQVPFTAPAGRRGFRDRVYEEYGVVVELDGRLAHPAENQWKDKARDNAAAAEGQQSLRYGWISVRRKACVTAVEVARVLNLHGWDGWPKPCAPGCPVQRG